MINQVPFAYLKQESSLLWALNLSSSPSILKFGCLVKFDLSCAKMTLHIVLLALIRNSEPIDRLPAMICA